MRSILFSFLFLIVTVFQAQNHLTKISFADADLPEWATLMYGENPNYYEVVNSYQAYFSEHEFVKTIHTQYFKRWVSSVKSHIDPWGNIQYSSKEELNQRTRKIREKQTEGEERGGTLWHFEGPEHHVVSDGTMTPGFRHSNVYCHDRSSTNPDVLFCGTESGGLYKTTDAGLNWNFVTADYLIGSVTAVRIKPSDENFIIMSAANDLWRSTDGGINWEIIGQPSFSSLNISAWEIAFNPEDNNIIYSATNEGFFRSIDGGDNWTEVLTRRCETIAFKPGDASVVYTIQYENGLDYSRFYKSTDYGATFTLYEEGWFDDSLGNIEIQGGRLATTEADPERIYAVLIGYQNDGSAVITNGWVGTWVSYDGGETWNLPHGLIGTPYTDEHPNLMNFNGDDGDYSQIHYNTTLIASQLDPDKILIGGLNLWKSTDAGATYVGVGGYIGGIDYFHVDQQEYRIYKTGPDTEEIWFSNDGGIGFSDDFMESHTNLNRGIYAVNLWGYDQGWNEDIMVGGRYHNGNMAYHENYPQGEFLALGGGEAATGYVKYTDENKTLFSDIGGYTLPEALNDNPEYFSLGQTPNESYWNNGSSRIMFDHQYFNVAWCGRNNVLYKSLNGAGSFSVAHTFGNNPDDGIYWMEQSFADENFMYVQQGIGNTSKIWRSADHGDSWAEIPLPQTWRYLCFTLSGVNPDELWVSYYDGGNGNKVYHTMDAGQSWDNLTTATLNDESVWAIAHQYGTDGGVYIAMLNGLVYYRNNSMTDWMSYSSGLPASSEPLRIVPFHRDNVIRLATWNLGVWEAAAYEPSELIANFSAEFESFFCPGNPVHFVNHSICSAEATFNWSFPGATPSTSTEQYPTVVYNEPGTYDVTLVVTDNGNSQSVTRTNYISSLSAASENIMEDFETGAMPENWINNGNGSWTIAEVSAFGQGQYCMRFDNFYYDAAGNRDEIWLGKSQYSWPVVEFDVAYAQYNEGAYTDTLAVLYSTDCGETWTEIFIQGGDDLATAPDNTSYFVPDNTQWEHQQILLDVITGEDVIFAFQNRGHYGNVIYVDNINILESVDVKEIKQDVTLMLYPNPSSGLINLSVGDLRPGECRIKAYDLMGKQIFDSTVLNVGSRLEKVIDLDNLAPGNYFLELTGDGINVVEPFEIR